MTTKEDGKQVSNEIPWGPTGEVVYKRTYSRTKPNGDHETWPETVRRVVTGNLGLVYGPKEGWGYEVWNEHDSLVDLMERFAILPAGRHLWASGVRGRQFLFNPVVGSSEVTTRDGVQKISELVGQTIDVLSMSDSCNYQSRQWESVGTWRPATFIYSGEQETYRVIFESGREVVSTAEHVWYTKRSRTKLTTLDLAGESVPVMVAPRPCEDGDYWVGMMRGIIFGDGTVTGDTPTGEPGKACIRIHSDEDRELLAVFEKFGHRATVHADGVGYVGRLPRAWKKEMPSLDESASYWRGFFAGWVAADGSVAKDGAVTLHNRDLHVMEYAVKGFLKAGVSAGSPVLCRTVNPFDGSDSTLYRLNFRRFTLTADDFIQQKKRDRFTAIPVSLKSMSDRVVSVEPTGRMEPVYCCLEPATRSWTVNGVLTGNCHVTGWQGEKVSEHFDFTLLRLAEGGGVGGNYSSRFLEKFGTPRRFLAVHMVCDPAHPDYASMKAAGLLSEDFSHEWEGAFPVEDSREGWAAALVDLIDTYMTDDNVKHSDRVYDLSRVRAKGQPLRTFGGTASGPQPFARLMMETNSVMNDARMKDVISPLHMMEIDHAIGECIVSGGVRRSARMSVVEWDDPFIFDFINCKADTGKHWTTNISVAIDNEFHDALRDPRHEMHDYAWQVHMAVTEAMLTNGEPGYWNRDLSNEGEVNEIVATNPCGEIPLPEWGACVLGHVNLDAFAPKVKGGPIDLNGLLEAHRLMTRFLIRATFGDMNDPKQKAVMDSERRIGVGHLGVQGFLAKQGVRFSQAPNNRQVRDLLGLLAGEVRRQARDYAFQLRIPEPIKTTTVAPTGSIAKLPGVTEGIHPIYARYFLRRVRFNNTDPGNRALLDQAEADGFDIEVDMYDPSGNTYVVTYPTKDKLVKEVEDLGYDPAIVEAADEITPVQMLAFQAMYQSAYADNAISMTLNIPVGSIDADELAGYLMRYMPHLKGTTVMPDGTRPQAPYERISKADYELYELIGRTRVEDSTDEDCATGACPVR